MLVMLAKKLSVLYVVWKSESVFSHVCNKWAAEIMMYFNYLPVCVFCLITLSNSLDPDQAEQNIGPVPDTYCLTPGGISKRIF